MTDLARQGSRDDAKSPLSTGESGQASSEEDPTADMDVLRPGSPLAKGPGVSTLGLQLMDPFQTDAYHSKTYSHRPMRIASLNRGSSPPSLVHPFPESLRQMHHIDATRLDDTSRRTADSCSASPAIQGQEREAAGIRTPRQLDSAYFSIRPVHHRVRSSSFPMRPPHPPIVTQKSYTDVCPSPAAYFLAQFAAPSPCLTESSEESMSQTPTSTTPFSATSSTSSLTPDEEFFPVVGSVPEGSLIPSLLVDEELAEGSIVGSYMLGRVIGRGHYGECREAYPLRASPEAEGSTEIGIGANLPQPIAFKAVRIGAPGASTTAASSELSRTAYLSFQKEVALWSGLSHPNILPLLDTIQTPRFIISVSPLAAHGDLLGYLSKHGPLSVSRTRRIFRQLVAAVHYLHRQANLAHRDIKLENILVHRHEHVYLTDFGLSEYIVPPSASTSSASRPSWSEAMELQLEEALRASTTITDVDGKDDFEGSRHMMASWPASDAFFTPSSSLSGASVFEASRPTTPCTPTSSESPTATAAGQQCPTCQCEASPSSELGSSPSTRPTTSSLPSFMTGTLFYAPPEEIDPESRQRVFRSCACMRQAMGPRADMWAMGIVLYALVRGALPFADDFLPRLQVAIRTGDYPLLDPRIYGDEPVHIIQNLIQVDVHRRWTISQLARHPWLGLKCHLDQGSMPPDLPSTAPSYPSMPPAPTG